MIKAIGALIMFGMALSGLEARAGAVVSYNGRILDPTGKPLEEPSVSFTISIYSSNAEKCLLYQERQIVNMTGSGGLFAIQVGSSAGIRTTSDPGIDLEKVFSNDPNLTFNTTLHPKLSCQSGSSYSPGGTDRRVVAVSFNDGKASGDQNLPGSEISYVPMALYSNNSHKLGGYESGDFIRINGSPSSSKELSAVEYDNLISIVKPTNRVAALETSLVGKMNVTGGTFTGAISAPAFLYTSDKSLKKDIKSYSDALVKVLSLRGVEFKWIANGKKEIGFIAQEVEKVEPDLVENVESSGKTHKAVKYGNVVAMLVEAIKEVVNKQDERDHQVTQELNQLKAEIEALRKQVGSCVKSGE